MQTSSSLAWAPASLPDLAPLARAGYAAVGRGVVVAFAEEQPAYLRFAEWIAEAAPGADELVAEVERYDTQTEFLVLVGDEAALEALWCRYSDDGAVVGGGEG